MKKDNYSKESIDKFLNSVIDDLSIKDREPKNVSHFNRKTIKDHPWRTKGALKNNNTK